MHHKPQKSPTALPTQKPIALKTNFFQLQIKNHSKNQILYKYTLTFSPEIPEDSKRTKARVYRSIHEDLQKSIGENLYIGNCLYALAQKDDPVDYVGRDHDTEYQCTVKLSSCISEKDPERYQVVKIIFNGLLKKLRLEQIGRNHFMMELMKKVMKHNVFVVPGYSSGIKSTTSGILINVDVSHRVLRHDTVWDYLRKTKTDRAQITSELVGTTVMTIYNRKTYRVTGIDFCSSPMSTFEDKNGNKIKLADYYEEKYKKVIKNKEQPLLIHENPKNRQKIQLIPEFCAMTGISDDMRKDFRFMKDLATMTNKKPADRFNGCAQLFQTIITHEKCKGQLSNWNMTLNKEGVDVQGKLYDSGKLLMGYNKRIDPNSPNIDKEIQAKMLLQPKLRKWAIFYMSKDEKIRCIFKDTFKKSMESFGYPVDCPAYFPVKTQHFEDWKFLLDQKLKNGADLIILLLPGSKKNSPLYHDLKELMLNKIPIPSQVVLTSTISKGKNLRSICNKILIQICAKVGGVPWTISELPTVQNGTMICGLAVQEVKNKNMSGVIGFISSKDKLCTKYYSSSKVLGGKRSRENAENISNILKEMMGTALEQYKKKSGEYPQNIIMYREGASESRRKEIELFEVSAIIKLIEEKGINTKLAYMLVCKRINVKLFRKSHSDLQNCHPGTVVNTGITEDDKEFFLISQRTLQGTSVPTHYLNCFNNTNISPSEIHALTYKLCFTYFNVSGSIRVPSLVQYATKFSDLMMNVSKPTKYRNSFQQTALHTRLQEISSLYFI